MALTRGLELAISLRITKLVVQIDNLACVQEQQEATPSRGEHTHLINKCLSLINGTSWTIKIIHVYREENRAADWLANQGVAQSIAVQNLDFAPVELLRILREDIRGVSYPRQVPA